MIYPYTIIKSQDIDFIYKFLKEIGFKYNSWCDKDFYKEYEFVYCVIDDIGVFGNFCFYVYRNKLAKNRKRDFVNNQVFISKIYKLLNISEI